jgi:hypothetical protein
VFHILAFLISTIPTKGTGLFKTFISNHDCT